MTIEALEARVARVEGIIEELRSRLTSIEHRLERLEEAGDVDHAGGLVVPAADLAKVPFWFQDKRSLKDTLLAIVSSKEFTTALGGAP